ncbi:MAG: nucleotide exchange factor GrpE [Anaerolineae bacterium]|nr:nucleotide exchange factor GrpE [Anaerolineae bacterium]
MSDEKKSATQADNQATGSLPPVDMMDLLEGDLLDDEAEPSATDEEWKAMQAALDQPQTGKVQAASPGAPPATADAPHTVTMEGDGELMAELDKVRAEAEEYLQGWQRARAEFANFRKRVDRERTTLWQEAAIDVLKRVLPVIDDFERAMTNVPQDLDDHDWVKGIGLIQQKLSALLDSYDLVEINPLGEPFDPELHEAIGTEDSNEYESQHVTMVLQKGYAWGDRVLRPALVRVAN